MKLDLKGLYKQKIVPSLIEEFGYKNIEQVPKLVKISVNRGIGEASKNSFHIKLLDTPPGPGSKFFSEKEQEEFKTIGAEYNRMSMKAHRADMKDLNMKLKLKREAIDMLPTTLLQEEAMIIDTNDGPHRRIPTWTPPIPNFDATKYNLNEKKE